MKKEIGVIFFLLACVALLIGLVFGAIAAFQFVQPGLLEAIGFHKTRPIHVSFVVGWIFLASVGGIYFYLQRNLGLTLYSRPLAKIHAWLFVITAAGIGVSYLAGKFGGREYWEFPVAFAVPIALSWILFAWNYFRTIRKRKEPWPVYLWMWSTGVIFFLLTFSESYLWLIPYFRDNIVRDLTVQWKAYGALVGSWNMLVYGTAIFLMEQTRKDGSVANSRLAFLMYFLGFTNLLFGWAHHLYTVPNQPWVRYISYFVSMTELIILARIIYKWRATLTDAMKEFHFFPSRFLAASEWWVFLNLILALAISVPAINLYTHGTHVTVAHAMGSSIGINTMILMASLTYAATLVGPSEYDAGEKKRMIFGFWLLQISLLVFWCSLIGAGVYRGIHIIERGTSFGEIMNGARPFFWVFAWSGLGILAGLAIILLPLTDKFFEYLRKKED
ncbi:MAG: cbb3-type cytochrome c oxidase subunit I [Bacteroidia bacterium]|nr:cbb3-type cytochrome c oxidase subunit I [Bacteroidia bacterium]